MNRHRRNAIVSGVSIAVLSTFGSAFAAAVPIEVWKSPSCGCCAEWVKHLRDNGFSVRVNDVGNNAARVRLGIPAKLGSCHTAQVSGYAIEGHVPAADIKRLLSERPDAIGLAVPGMPVGSPGMEDGERRERYDVQLVVRGGGTRVYQSYP